jgi:peptidoglycan-N-acetylglucosamine deacetylase
MSKRLAAISVDLDEVPCYAAIFGLSVPTGSEHAIYDFAVPRLRELFAREGIPATFFAIGRDVERNAASLRQLSEDGHEIGNHSDSHFYDLTRRSRGQIRDEIAGAGDRIERAVGRRPVGFRGPGYTITDEVFDVLGELSYTYDSSVFPCPAYFAAKSAAIGAIRMAGRRSRSIVDDPRVLTAPADPYRIGTPYWRRGSGMLELPIGVTRDLMGRLPYFGTSVVMSGGPGARLLTEAVVGRPLVNLELHGIDLSDASADGLTWLKPHQQDLRRSASAKGEALRSAIATLRRHRYEFVTLEEAAARMS